MISQREIRNGLPCWFATFRDVIPVVITDWFPAVFIGMVEARERGSGRAYVADPSDLFNSELEALDSVINRINLDLDVLMRRRFELKL